MTMLLAWYGEGITEQFSSNGGRGPCLAQQPCTCNCMPLYPIAGMLDDRKWSGHPEQRALS